MERCEGERALAVLLRRYGVGERVGRGRGTVCYL